MDFYVQNRIQNQRSWYVGKARRNRLMFKLWATVSVAVYASAIAIVLLKLRWPEYRHFSTDPLLVAAASIMGWIQIKKYSELASTYTLTAHEIGLLQGKLDDVSSDAEFSEFVNEAELAFSREHTQWVARKGIFKD